MKSVHYAVFTGDYLTLDLAESEVECLAENKIAATIVTNVTTVGALYYKIHLHTLSTEEMAQKFIQENKNKIRMPNVYVDVV